MRITDTVRRKTTAYGMLLLLVVNLFSGAFADGAAVSVAAEAEAFALDVTAQEAGQETGQDEAESTGEKSNVSARVLYEQENEDGIFYVKNEPQVEFEIYIPENDDANAELFWEVGDESNSIKESGTQTVGGEDNKKYTYQKVFSVGEGSYTLHYGLRISGVEQSTKDISFVLDNTVPELNIALDTESVEGKAVCNVSVREQNFASGSIAVRRKRLGLESEESWSYSPEFVADEHNGTFTSRVVFEEDGIYTIWAVAKDKAGNQAETEPVEFTIDNSAPVLEFDGMENEGFYNDRERTLTLRYTDLSGRLYETASADTSGSETENLPKAESLYQITVKRDDGVAEDFHAVWKPEQNMPYVSKTDIVFGSSETNESLFAQEGRYTITFDGWDAYGNKVEKPVKITFVIDRTAPDIPAGNLTLSYADGQSELPEPRREENTEVYYFHGDAKLDFQVEELNYDSAELYIEESRDGSAFERRQPYGMKQKKDHATVLFDKEGRYTTRVWAKDKAGNYEGKAGADADVYSGYIRHFVVDKTAPVFRIEGIDRDNQYCQTGAELTVVAKDANHDLDTYQIAVKRTDLTGHTMTVKTYTDSEGWSAPVSGEIRRTIEVSGEGNYVVEVTGKDKAGNEGVKTSAAFRVDTTAPVIRLSGVADGACYNDSIRMSLQINELNFADTDAQIVVTRKLGAETVVTPPEERKIDMDAIVTQTEYIYQQEGDYTVEITAVDGAGNHAVKKTVHFTIDKKAPVLSITGIANQEKTRNPVTLLFQAKDYNHDFSKCVISVTRSDVDGEIEYSDNTYPKEEWEQQGITAGKSITFSEEGIYMITFNAVDMAGNTAVQQQVAFFVDRSAPVISNVTYTDGREKITTRYQNIYSNHAILVEFQIKDQVTGVNPQRVYVTVGSETDRTDVTSLYPAHKALGDTYYVYVPTDLNISELNNAVTIWANDMLDNEAVYTSANIIYHTGRPYIQMECDVDYTKWTNQSVTFETTVTDETAGLKEIVYKIDGKVVKRVTFKELTTTYSYALTAVDSADKVTGYPVSVEVTNNCGTTAAMKRQVYIDKVKPKVQLSGIVNGMHYNTSKAFTTDVEDVSYKNTKTVYHIKRTLDGKKTSMSAAVLKSKKYADTGSRKMIKEGSYEIYAVTTDSAGNRAVSNTLKFVIDKTAPKLSISGVENGTMSGTEVRLEFSCEESFFATNKVTISAERVLDGKESREEIGGFPIHQKNTSMSHTFTEDGTYQVTMSATDKAGNSAMPQTIRFHVDRTKPVIRITGTDNYEQWDEAAVVQFAVEESYYSNNSVTIRGTRTDIDGNVTEVELPDFVNTGKVSSLIQKFEEDGKYEFEVVSKDEAGNRESGSIHFTVDRTAPEINGVAQYQGGCYQRLRFGDSLEDIFKDLTVISCRILLNGIEYDGISDITEEGKYTLDIEVQDELGHISSEIVEFIVDHTPPKVLFSGVMDGETVHESGVVTLSLTNTEDIITDVRMNGVHYGADVRSLSYQEYGSYQVEVDCVDKAGNAVTRSLYFVYSNPAVRLMILGGTGVLVISMLIWLWIWTRRKESEEGRNA